MEDKEKIERIAREAKELLSLFEEVKDKSEINNKSLIFKYLDRMLIAKTIVPFLEIKDVLNFSETCRDIKAGINSTVGMVAYYKTINSKRQENNNLETLTLRNPNELNDVEDVQAELDNAKRVNTNLIY